MMEKFACYLCGDLNAVSVLDKPPVQIWTNAGDDEEVNVKYRCRLNQCAGCGHVYQPTDKKLDDLLNIIYQSEHAQVST
ncbi:MAG TPA: hypothetical protein VFJ43_04705, partial [Bacteroidia bacterium]|nr:hypothetical protein [Bacteroidia bacterium]